MRNETKEIKIGKLTIGGNNPIYIQSMTNTKTCDVKNTIDQILDLQKHGCEIVRVAIPNSDDAKIFQIAKSSGVVIPLVADIHFDYRIAIEAVKYGADKIRINPGNITEKWKIKEIITACKEYGIPIRIGVNSGSIRDSILKKYGHPTAEALAESAIEEITDFENMGFQNIVVSVKSSDVEKMVKANEIVSSKCNYPIHIGVTEAGDMFDGIIKNSIGIGKLLLDGIGDTVRVSLTSDPLNEVIAAKKILGDLNMGRGYINLISCPTCGRTNVNMIEIVEKFKLKINDFIVGNNKITIAIMGCAVNGPGEAREADFGVACGNGNALFFVEGVPKESIPENDIVDYLYEYLLRYVGNKNELK